MPPAVTRSQTDRYVPKHRKPPAHRASRAAARTMFVLSGAAVVGTGAAVAGGSLTLVPQSGPSAADASPVAAAAASTSVQALTGEQDDTGASTEAGTETGTETGTATEEPGMSGGTAADADRAAPVSRSDRRPAADPRKLAALAQEAAGNALTRSEDVSDEDPRTVASMLVGDATQFDCLDSLWTKESGWRVDADNPSSSAYGIPQALPGSKMSTFGADWATNPVTQIRWGLDYIEDRYGSPCGAWSHSQSYNWY